MDYGDEFGIICEGDTIDNDPLENSCEDCCVGLSCEFNILMSDDEDFYYYTCQWAVPYLQTAFEKSSESFGILDFQINLLKAFTAFTIFHENYFCCIIQILNILLLIQIKNDRFLSANVFLSSNPKLLWLGNIFYLFSGTIHQ